MYRLPDIVVYYKRELTENSAACEMWEQRQWNDGSRVGKGKHVERWLVDGLPMFEVTAGVVGVKHSISKHRRLALPSDPRTEAQKSRLACSRTREEERKKGI